jgi:predicted nuclease of restriction endonuclease-like (RecB) superfamily
MSRSLLPDAYPSLLEGLKSRIGQERLRVVMAANAAMVLLYWEIGRAIGERQEAEGWGTKVIDRLAVDLQRAFPDMRGLSARNLKYMRAFAAAWPELEVVQQAAAQIPWGHNLVLLDRLDSVEDRLWYARKANQEGWSRAILNLHLDRRVHQRQGQAITNFARTLPAADSDMAAQIFKDPYLFDFLGTADPRREREVESALIEHIQRFLLELGAGFSYVGRQVRLQVGDRDFYMDLLFYHLRLRAFVVIELKARSFDPGDAGQLNFYLSAVDDLMRHPTDSPSIGLLLVRDPGQDRVIVEYALRGVNRPIGVAGWETELVRQLPEGLRGSLPTVEELEEELAGHHARPPTGP